MKPGEFRLASGRVDRWTLVYVVSLDVVVSKPQKQPGHDATIVLIGMRITLQFFKHEILPIEAVWLNPPRYLDPA